MKLDKKALGLAVGIVWALTVFLATLWISARGGGEHFILLKQFYFGYSISFLGSLIGLVYGFVNGFIWGWTFGWFYNTFVKSE
jgi:hypothetical protein